jgi:hypothetical protein
MILKKALKAAIAVVALLSASQANATWYMVQSGGRCTSLEEIARITNTPVMHTPEEVIQYVRLAKPMPQIFEFTKVGSPAAAFLRTYEINGTAVTYVADLNMCLDLASKHNR